MPEPAHLSAPLSSRRFNGCLRARAGALFVSALAWLSFVAALVLIPALFVESLPARAVTGIVLQPPHGGWPRINGGGGSIRPAAPPPIHPPKPRPLTLVQPPETIQPPENDPEPANHATEGAEGPSGIDGPGSPGGTPGDCLDCAGNGPGGGLGPASPGIPGDETSGVPEDHPGLERPRIIPSSRAVPDYPAMARRARVMGTVQLRIVIDEQGRVGEIEVVRTPDARYGFDLAAIEAVKRWRYVPGRLGGRPVAVEAFVLVEFTLAR